MSPRAVWTQCNSCYRNCDGRNVANWPGYMREYVERTLLLDPSEFTFVALPDHERAELAVASSHDVTVLGSSSGRGACKPAPVSVKPGLRSPRQGQQGVSEEVRGGP